MEVATIQTQDLAGTIAASASGFRCYMECAGGARQDDVAVPLARVSGTGAWHASNGIRRWHGDNRYTLDVAQKV